MAGQDYTQMTPGFAVANQLQEILANRRADARQAMMDQLTQQQVNSRMDYDRENIESLRESRAASAEQRRSQADERDARVHNESERRAAVDAFRKSPAFGQLPPQYQTMFDISGGDENMLRVLAQHYLTPNKPEPGGEVYQVTPKGIEDTGRWSEKGEQFIHLPQEATQPKGPEPTLYQFDVPDPNDPTKTITESHWLHPGEQPSPGTLLNGKLRKGNLPTPPRQASVTTGDDKELARLRGLAATGGFGPSDKNVANYYSFLQTYINKFAASQDVKDAVREIEQKHPNSSLSEIFGAVSFDNPADKAVFANLMHAVRGQ